MDGQQDMVSITVLIAGRPYPLKIKAGDEPSIRQIVKEINDKINRFQLTYTTKDKQDCLAMAVLTYAVDLHKTGSEDNTSGIKSESFSAPDQPEVLQRLSRLQSLLDDMLA